MLKAKEWKQCVWVCVSVYVYAFLYLVYNIFFKIALYKAVSQLH